MIQNKYFEWYYENPFTTYNKIKAFFKPLTWKWTWSFRKGNAAKIFEFNSFDVRWKDKWDSPRHEISPTITVSLFNYIHLTITFICDSNYVEDMVYWETALYWIYYKKHLPKALDLAGGWEEADPTTGVNREIKCSVLKEPWQALYNNKKLHKIYYEDTI